MVEVKSKKYLQLFGKFIEQLRIDSKEETAASAEDGVKLEMWDSQRRVLETIGEGLDEDIHMFLVLKSRQLGVSTITLAILLFWLAIHPRTFGALVVDNDSNRDTFRDILTRYVESFPPGYLGKAFTLTKNNRNHMIFSNGSRLDFLVAGKSKDTWGESRAYTVAMLTEVSKYGNPAGISSFMEALSETNPNRLYILESTAYGPNHWQRMWDDAENDIFTKRRVFVGWWSKKLNSIPKTDPRFHVFGVAPPDARERNLIGQVGNLYGHKVTAEQLAWYRWRSNSKSASKEDLAQNQPWTASEAFVLSGFSFFQTNLLNKHMEIAKQEQFLAYRFYLGNDFLASTIEQITDPARRPEIELRVWDLPEQGAKYTIGVDPAYGRSDNADKHCISVWRCYADRIVQVAEWADNRHETRQCAWVLAYIAGMYRDCMVNLEVTGGWGHAVVQELDSLRMNLRQTAMNENVTLPDDVRISDVVPFIRWYLYHRPDSLGQGGYVYHWQTQGSSKFRLMNGFRDRHTTDQLGIKSVNLVREMQDVVQEGFSVGAPGKLHDDRVFAAALACEAWVSWMRAGLISTGQTYARVHGLEERGIDMAAIVNTAVERALTAKPQVEENSRDRFLREMGLT